VWPWLLTMLVFLVIVTYWPGYRCGCQALDDLGPPPQRGALTAVNAPARRECSLCALYRPAQTALL
jgi:hypothetical protein